MITVRVDIYQRSYRTIVNIDGQDFVGQVAHIHDGNAEAEREKIDAAIRAEFQKFAEDIVASS